MRRCVTEDSTVSEGSKSKGPSTSRRRGQLPRLGGEGDEMPVWERIRSAALTEIPWWGVQPDGRVDAVRVEQRRLAVVEVWQVPTARPQAGAQDEEADANRRVQG